MANAFEQFEVQNLAGTTDHYVGTPGTSFVNLPAVDGFAIQSVLIQNTSSAAGGLLEVVLHEGATTTFWTLQRDGILAADVKGSIKHIQIRGATAGASYQAIINREDC